MSKCHGRSARRREDMSHINHRRGDTRQCSKHDYQRCFYGHWNRTASRYYRAAVHRILRNLSAKGNEAEVAEDIIWPLANEVDNEWNYD